MQDPSFPEKKTCFERHPKKTLCIIVISLLCFIDFLSFGILKIRNINTKPNPSNRTISGYYVFKNVPGHRYGTIKRDPSDPDVVTDQYGFVSDIPLTRTKNKNTIRIFLMGGSAAFGAGQATRAAKAEWRGVPKYPRGLHTYRLTIAGYLKEFLEKQRPGINFEVINTAAYTRRFNQSMGLYAESVSRFSPDYVVNMDGFNDIWAFATGEFYSEAEEKLERFIDLEVALRSFDIMRYSNTFLLGERVLQRYIGDRFALDAQRNTYRDRKADDYPWEDYQKNRSRYIKNSNRFIQILRHHMALLNSDNVGFVFVVQPMLNRVTGNKQFSSDEFKILEKMYPPVGEAEGNKQDRLTHAMLTLKYFFDDYFSERIRMEVKGQGNDFIDMGLEFQGLDKSITAYTDYCHLTPEANRFIAGKIGETILKRGLKL